MIPPNVLRITRFGVGLSVVAYVCALTSTRHARPEPKAEKGRVTDGGGRGEKGRVKPGKDEHLIAIVVVVTVIDCAHVTVLWARLRFAAGAQRGLGERGSGRGEDERRKRRVRSEPVVQRVVARHLARLVAVGGRRRVADGVRVVAVGLHRRRHAVYHRAAVSRTR
ncbi:hypothetical protein T492DRAFT_1144811 [Pavlovales sp. CCMP2436]|nr:hypothetical protein T492DRAFT_1144811 [Pavlovales sp. CCMP2436]